MPLLHRLQSLPIFRVFLHLWDLFLHWFDTAPLWQLGVAALVPTALVSTAIRRQAAQTLDNPVYAKLGRKVIRMREFFAHFYITGRPGSGKTRACINALLYEVFKRVPKWGGCMIDDKGDAHTDLMAYAAQVKRTQDVVVIQSRPTDAAPDWKPEWSWNPLLDTRFPDSTHAETYVRTANAVRRTQNKEAFWEPIAILHITHMITALRLTKQENLAIDTVMEILTEQKGERLNKVIVALNSCGDPKAPGLIEHFVNFLNSDQRLLDNMRGTITAYLSAYCEPTLREIFCAPVSNFNVAMVDEGKIVCCSISPAYAIGRRLYSALLKNMICEHANLRFGLNREDQAKTTPLILLMDEAQMSVSADPQKGDHTFAALLRQARLAFVMATQDPVLSFIPMLGKEVSDALKLNLSNQIHLQAASPEAAKWIADLVGKEEVPDLSTSTTPQGVTRNRGNVKKERYWMTPEKVRGMKPFYGVFRHADGSVTHRPVYLPPIAPDGRRG